MIDKFPKIFIYEDHKSEPINGRIRLGLKQGIEGRIAKWYVAIKRG